MTAAPRLRLFVAGYKRHGKDTVCELVRQHFGLAWAASSQMMTELAVLPHFRALRAAGRVEVPDYPDAAACFADRGRWRGEWYDAIQAFNTPDGARLARLIFAEHEVYCGIRSREELDACRAAGLCDALVWVDASRRLPPEDAASCTIGPADADLVLDNNGTAEELAAAVPKFWPAVMLYARWARRAS